MLSELQLTNVAIYLSKTVVLFLTNARSDIVCIIYSLTATKRTERIKYYLHIGSNSRY